MKRMLLKSATLGLLSVLALTLFSGVVLAQTDNLNARFALHARSQVAKAATLCTTSTPNAAGLPCTDYTVTYSGASGSISTVYLVVGQASLTGLAAVSCGINYTSNLYVTWASCGDLDFTNGPTGLPEDEWPQPAGGNRITWVLPANCQNEPIGGRGVHAVAGSFYVYVYGDDVLELTPNNNLVSGPELAVTDCAGSSTILFPDVIDESLLPVVLGRVQFGNGRDGLTGFTPCNDIVPARQTSWGKIKTLYEEDK